MTGMELTPLRPDWTRTEVTSIARSDCDEFENCKSYQFPPQESRQILSTELQRRLIRTCCALEAMKCPYCSQEIGIRIAALADETFMLRTPCEKCGKEFLIVEGVPMTEEQYSSHNFPRP